MPRRVIARDDTPAQTVERDRAAAPGKSTHRLLPEAAARLSLEGMILPNARIKIRTTINGIVEKVGFQEGAPVKQGQLLVQVANSRLAAEVRATEAELKNAELDSRRLRGVEENHKGLVSQEDLDKAEGALDMKRAHLELKKAEMAQTRIIAPCDGIMGASDIQPGESVTPGTIVGVLYDVSSFKVQFNVSAKDVDRLRTRQKIQIKVDTHPSEVLEGEIYFVAPAIDEVTRTVQVKANLAKTDLRLWSGMRATVSLTLPTNGESE